MSSYRIGEKLYVWEHCVYEGAVRKGKQHGEGTGYFVGGQVWYRGNWSRGKRHGFGKGFLENGSVSHEGAWYYDHYWKDNKMYDVYGRLVYEGQNT